MAVCTGLQQTLIKSSSEFRVLLLPPKFMNEDDEGFLEILAQILAENSQDEYNKAREVMGEKGIVLARDGNIIRLYPDDSFDIIKKI